MDTPRRRRANGEASRGKIIEAATEIASERGYEATSISAVSERSGLPSSSIYWHFKDKDDLIAAVIQHSFERWRAQVEEIRRSDAGGALASLMASMRDSGEALREAPHFLRLGLMLTLERLPEEPTASRMFREVRRTTRDEVVQQYHRLFGKDLDERTARTLAVMTIAAADGLFVAREIEGGELDIDFGRAFELMGVALHAVAQQLVDAQATDGDH